MNIEVFFHKGNNIINISTTEEIEEYINYIDYITIESYSNNFLQELKRIVNINFIEKYKQLILVNKEDIYIIKDIIF